MTGKKQAALDPAPAAGFKKAPMVNTCEAILSSSVRFLGPAEAAHRLGISAKALRLYEAHGLVAPIRNAAGWRSYGPADMQRAEDIVALRALGLGLAQVAGMLQGGAEGPKQVLAAHQAALEGRVRQLAGAIEKVHGLRAGLSDGHGHAPTAEAGAGLPDSMQGPVVEFELPWPWGGERFALRGIRRLNYIVGPLGSGKTRLAQRLAEVLPSATFLGLERATDGVATARLAADRGLSARVEWTLARLVADGAIASDALVALVAALEAEASAALVVDLVEQGLDTATQRALAAHLRHRGTDIGGTTDTAAATDVGPLFLLTRSSVILDLAAVGADESIIFCPANHSPPMWVAPCPGAAGYEAVASCLATPEVRARTEGVIAWRRRPVRPPRAR